MTRPCFMVIEREYPGNISARKLVIETAKLNVISCYSAAEGIDTLRRFPYLDGIVLSTDVQDLPCTESAARLKSISPHTPLVVISPSGYEDCEAADRRVSSHDPEALLHVLQELVLKAAA